MPIAMTKPLNVQFELKDEAAISDLLDLAREVGDLRGDRRLGAGAIAKELLIRLLKSGQAASMLGVDESPKAESQPQGKKKAA